VPTITPKKNTVAETPLMKQYNQIKSKHPDAVLLFRVGDFYETFREDAILASRVLGITLTQRKNGAAATIELAGFPHHSLETYLPKLVKAGYRVAICDQLEDPKLTKKIVKRGVTELVTPGVAFNENVLDNRKNNFLSCVCFDKKNAGVSFLDITTGEFLVAEGNIEYIEKLLSGFQPSELLFSKKDSKIYDNNFGDTFHKYGLEEWIFSGDFATENLLNHFETTSLKGFGIQDMPLAILAAGACLHYIAETRQDKVKHINKISRIERDKFVWLDGFTIRNLELFNSNSQGGKTLIDILDQTKTPMGSRTMKRWLALPLKDKKPIDERLSIVSFLNDKTSFSDSLAIELKSIGDLERLISKVAVKKATPKDLLQIKTGLQSCQTIKSSSEKLDNDAIKGIADRINPCNTLIEKIENWVQPDAPVLVSKGGVIKKGVSEELDEYRGLAFSGKDYLLNLQKEETQKTGIPSLKIGFNNVFGYYLEVTNTHKNKVPEDWIRKQTLVNAERYITPELKEYESKILSAEEKILKIETELYAELVEFVNNYLEPIQINAQNIATLDCLLSFANISTTLQYTKPKILEEKTLNIFQGRHPVIEQNLPIGERFVPNDIHLDTENQQIMMITGPNMSGKSAVLRQTALIVLMAQMGCFVPAKGAEIGLVDKIFTRVGASDNISQGESTFMVEMNETASILNNLSDRSLILLDEIGRGTSTYDGISIAWAIAEYLHNHPNRPKTLFATHYHELNEMQKTFERVKNFNVSVKELTNKVIFLRKIVPGGSEHSFGIHVAKMAGMPPKLINRANKVLKELEASHSKDSAKTKLTNQAQNEMQLSIFQLDDPTLAQIKHEIELIDIDTLTPVEALLKLNEIKNILKG